MYFGPTIAKIWLPTGLSSIHTYYYRVRAKNSAGVTSAYTGFVSARPYTRVLESSHDGILYNDNGTFSVDNTGLALSVGMLSSATDGRSIPRMSYLRFDLSGIAYSGRVFLHLSPTIQYIGSTTDLIVQKISDYGSLGGEDWSAVPLQTISVPRETFKYRIDVTDLLNSGINTFLLSVGGTGNLYNFSSQENGTEPLLGVE